MTDQLDTGDRREPQRAYVNGAALAALTGLLTSQTSDIRNEIARVEDRLGQQITRRFDDHNRLHGLERESDLDFREKMLKAVGQLEAADAAGAEAAKLRQARMDGRRDLFRPIVALPGSIEKHRVGWLLLIAGAAAIGGAGVDFTGRILAAVFGIKF